MLGVVLQTYGCGNAPNNRDDLIAEIKKATRRGVLIINCTQCLHGPVVDQYATGKVRTQKCLILFEVSCNFFGLELRNRKHVPCFYRVIETRVKVWENEKCCGNTSRISVFL